MTAEYHQEKNISFRIQRLKCQFAEEEMWNKNEKNSKDNGEVQDGTRIQSLSKQRHNFNISPPTISRDASGSAQIAFGPYRSTTSIPPQFTRQIAAFDNRSQSTEQIGINQGIDYSPHTATYPSRQTAASPYQQNASEEGNRPLYCLYINEKQSSSFTPIQFSRSPQSRLEGDTRSHFEPISPEISRLASASLQPGRDIQSPFEASSIRPMSSLSVETAGSKDSTSTYGSRSRATKELGSGKRRGKRKSGPSPSHIDQEAVDKKSPPPQNLRGDPFRSAKVKTELCRHYNTEKGCPFGNKCNYAHGEHELKFTKLLDLERAGLIDIEVFRTHPCITWLSTGTCPFDQRCIGIHDPRVRKRDGVAWLSHAETVINSVGGGENVDKLYHQRLASVYSCCPLYGYKPPRKWNENSNDTDKAWRSFYEFVCNFGRNNPVPSNKVGTSITPSHSPRTSLNIPHLSEVHVFQIVIKMREQKLGKSFAYLPTHLFCGELCMALQTKVFRLVPTDGTPRAPSKLIEVIDEEDESSSHLSQRSFKQFKVYELAFGPVGDPSVRPVSIWFGINKTDITKCTPQQAKHHKRSRHRLKKKGLENTLLSTKISRSSGQHETVKQSRSTIVPPFNHYQPHDDTTFEFVSDILNHRYQVLLYLTGEFYDKPVEEIEYLLNRENHRLKAVFKSLRMSWVTSSWPFKQLNEEINDNTDIPDINEEYNFRIGQDSFQSEAFHGTNDSGQDIITPATKLLPAFLWKSFITNIQFDANIPSFEIQKNSKTPYDSHIRRLRRLPILRHLSLGQMVDTNRQLPNLRKLRSSYQSVSASIPPLSIEMLFNNWKLIRSQFEKNQPASSRPTSSSAPSPSLGTVNEEVSLQRHEDAEYILNNATNMSTRMSL